MYEPLWALHTIFEDIYPWSLIWKSHDVIRSKMDNAIYTWEQKLVQQLEGNSISRQNFPFLLFSKDAEPQSETDKKTLVEKTKTMVLLDYRADASKATMLYYHDILKTIIMPPFEKLVIPACKTIIEPISELIPEPLKQFLDPNKMFEELINGIVDDSIETVLNSDEMTTRD